MRPCMVTMATGIMKKKFFMSNKKFQIWYYHNIVVTFPKYKIHFYTIFRRHILIRHRPIMDGIP